MARTKSSRAVLTQPPSFYKGVELAGGTTELLAAMSRSATRGPSAARSVRALKGRLQPTVKFKETFSYHNRQRARGLVFFISFS
jgi:hypothetical protein